MLRTLKPSRTDPPSRHPDIPGMQPELKAELQKVSLATDLGATTRAALDQAGTPLEWNALFLSSPEFMRR